MSITSDGRPRRVRYTVEIGTGLDDRIAQLAAEQDVSKAECIRVGAQMLAEFAELQRRGFTVGGWRENEDGSKDTAQLLMPI